MRITILTTGTRGDTQPYLALGLALKNVGQTVRVAAFENYEDFVKSYGLEFFPIKGDITRMAASLSTKDARQADNPFKVILSFNKLKSFVVDIQQDFYNACLGSDAIVYHPGAAIGYFAAQYLKIPAILATPFPMTPTADYPALIFYDTIRLGKIYNFSTHKIFEQIMWFASSSAVKQFWFKKFGKTPEKFESPFGKQKTRQNPTIISCSKYVFPQPDDWPAHVETTGYWFGEESNWQPDNRLLDFLQKGPAPVYVGFGSLGNPAQAVQTTQLVIDALQKSGQRGILATGWNGLSAQLEDIPEGILIIESAPHTWLFPRIAPVVHHGGAGTTAAGMRAGVPSIIIPHSNDQFAWGRRVFELGIGPKPIPRKELTSEKLSAAINFALSIDIRAVAKDFGIKIQSEDGAATAATIIINSMK